MSTDRPTDQLLSTDARAYRYRNYQSVLPLPEWGTLAAWRRRRKEIRRHLLLCAGLNAKTAAFRARGRIVRRFIHEGVRVENLCIETLPGLYVVGNLYLPEERSAPVPLVLHPHGHMDRARTTVADLFSLPHRAFNTALHGCAAFAYSMLDHEDDMRQFEHRSLLTGPEKKTCNLLGLSPFGLQLHNSMKALDYLLGRREIDARRVGCTGESGGGTQTYFLAAADERVTVAAPAVMLSGHFQGGCVCENAPQLHLQYSNLEYAGLIAPRPLLLTGCTGDWTHHARERELPALRDLYELYDARDRVDLFYQDEAHNYNRASREAVYAWMVRWLLDGGAAGPKRLRESKVEPPSREELLVFDGPVPPYVGAIDSSEAVQSMWRGTRRTAPVADIADVLPFEAPAAADVLIRSQPPRHAYRDRRWYRLRHGRFSHDSALDCHFLAPESGRPGLLVLLHGDDERSRIAFSGKPPKAVQQLIDAGWGIFLPRLFGQGGDAQERAYAEREDSYLSTTYQPTVHQLQGDDILTTVRMIQVEFGVQPAQLTAVADADQALLAWAAWARLTSKEKAGPLVADLGGMDLTDAETWARTCYLPLLLGVGGAAALARLGKVSGTVSGVRAADRGLLPARWKSQTKRRNTTQLLAAVG